MDFAPHFRFSPIAARNIHAGHVKKLSDFSPTPFLGRVWNILCRYGRKSKVRGKVVRIGRLGGVLDGFPIIVKSNQNPHSIWERLLIPPQPLGMVKI